MIRTIGLTKRYGKVEALSDVSLEVSPGEILALVGPNGAGKTTALKLLVGLLTPTAGAVSIAGYDVLRQPLEAKRILAFLPDQPFLYEQLTVSEMLGFIGGMYQLPHTVLRDRVQALGALFGLEELFERRIDQLSYGMKSRLVLIASLLHEPKVFILDEPFFGLDPQTLRLMKHLLAERARQGMTIVLSTHQLTVVEDLAHRIAVLSSGRVVALGTWHALQQRYGGNRLEEVFFHLTSPPPDGA